MLWVLSLFGFSNQGEEKSTCHIHAAVLTVLCPYVSPSVFFFVCLYEQLRSTLSDVMNEKKVEKSDL